MIRKQKLPRFKSLIQLSQLFDKIISLLNQRPIFYKSDSYVTAQDLMFPSTSTATNLLQTIDDVDENFRQFLTLYSDMITSGMVTKIGTRAKTQIPDIREGDFVMIRYPSRQGFYKYGIVSSKISDRKYSIKMLIRRNKDGTGQTGFNEVDIQNIVLLHRPL